MNGNNERGIRRVTGNWTIQVGTISPETPLPILIVLNSSLLSYFLKNFYITLIVFLDLSVKDVVVVLIDSLFFSAGYGVMVLHYSLNVHESLP